MEAQKKVKTCKMSPSVFQLLVLNRTFVGLFFFFWLWSFDSIYHCNLTVKPYCKDVLKSCTVKQHRDCLVSLVLGGQ